MPEEDVVWGTLVHSGAIWSCVAGPLQLRFDCGRWMCECAVPAEANVLVTCRRLSNDEPEVIEIHRDDTATSAVVITPPTSEEGLYYIGMYSLQLMSFVVHRLSRDQTTKCTKLGRNRTIRGEVIDYLVHFRWRYFTL